MNNLHRLLFIVYYFEDPHSFVEKMQQQTERYQNWAKLIQ